MRFIVVLIFLLLVAGAGAYITRPSEGLHRGVATALMTQGKAERPAATTGHYEFDDYYLVTFSAMSSGDENTRPKGMLASCTASARPRAAL